VADHPGPPSVAVSSSQRHGRSWPAILLLTASSQVVPVHPHSSSQRHGVVLPVSRQVVNSHPPPPSVAASSSQRHGRSWSAILHPQQQQTKRCRRFRSSKNDSTHANLRFQSPLQQQIEPKNRHNNTDTAILQNNSCISKQNLIEPSTKQSVLFAAPLAVNDGPPSDLDLLYHYHGHASDVLPLLTSATNNRDTITGSA